MFFSCTVHTLWEQNIKASVLSVCLLFKWLSLLALWEFNIPSHVWRKTSQHKNGTSDNIKLLLSNNCRHLLVYRCAKQTTVEFYKQMYCVSKSAVREQIEQCSVIMVPAEECSTTACLCCRTSTAAQDTKPNTWNQVDTCLSIFSCCSHLPQPCNSMAFSRVFQRHSNKTRLQRT